VTLRLKKNDRDDLKVRTTKNIRLKEAEQANYRDNLKKILAELKKRPIEALDD